MSLAFVLQEELVGARGVEFEQQVVLLAAEGVLQQMLMRVLRVDVEQMGGGLSLQEREMMMRLRLLLGESFLHRSLDRQ